jgi:hypothetical protein
MTRTLFAAAIGLSLMTTMAAAQTAPSDNTVPAIVAPPEGILSTSRTQHRVEGNGTVTDSSRTTYRNDAGVADDVHTTKTTHPAATTTTSSSASSSTTTR